MTYYSKHIFVCTNQKADNKTCCASAGGEDCFHYLKSKLVELNAHGPSKIRVSKSGCLGRCASGPCIVIYPEGIWYRYNSMADIDKIIDNHLIHQKIVPALLLE